MRSLLVAIKLPGVIQLDNDAIVSNEELMLVGLFRMAYPCRLINIAREFGGEITLWSRAVKYFVYHCFKDTM